MLKVGDIAPDFNALDQNLERFILAKALKRGKVLLVFYPKDFTPVCTAQLCDYRDHYPRFEALGVQVYGISIGNLEDHLRFKETHHLPFPLLNDYDSRITKHYGVISMMGTPKRALYLIGEDRRILYEHVELLPIFRRSGEALIHEIRKVLGHSGELPPPLTQQPAQNSDAAAHH